MKISKSYLLLLVACFTIFMPNLDRNIWLYLLTLSLSIFLLFNKINQTELIYISVFFIIVISPHIFGIEGLKYSSFFLANCFLYWSLTKYLISSRALTIKFIELSSLILPLTLLIGLAIEYQIITVPLQNSENYYSIDFFKRSKALFSEPAFLGYWSSFLIFLSIKHQKHIHAIVFSGLLFISFSVGAFFYALLLFNIFFKIKSIKVYIIIILSLFAFVFLGFKDQTLLKISSASASLRFENVIFLYQEILKNFFIPYGAAPFKVTGTLETFSSLSFIMILAKVISPFALLISSVLIFYKLGIKKIFPLIFIMLMSGNYWETPILLNLFLFLRDNNKT